MVRRTGGLREGEPHSARAVSGAAQVNKTVRQYLVELEQQNPTEEPVHQQDHVSTTDPDATYATKGGTPARLGYYDNYLIDNHSCVIVGVRSLRNRRAIVVLAVDLITAFGQVMFQALWNGHRADVPALADQVLRLPSDLVASAPHPIPSPPVPICERAKRYMSYSQCVGTLGAIWAGCTRMQKNMGIPPPGAPPRRLRMFQVPLGLAWPIQCYEPVPSKTSVCGLPLSESVTLNVPVLEPVAAGVNVTLMVQVPPLAAIDVQPLLWTLKSPLFVPVIVAEVTVTVVVP